MEGNNLIELIKNIRSLSKSWGLLDKGDLGKQSLKIREEVGEFCRAYLRVDREGMKDAIGDIGIAVINYRLITGLTPTGIIQSIGENYEPTPVEINDILMNRICTRLRVNDVMILACSCDLSFLDCLEHSYNTIKSRTGRMVDGCFVKDEEPEKSGADNELLQECLLQLEYLSEKFGETGTGNNLITRLKSHLI